MLTANGGSESTLIDFAKMLIVMNCFVFIGTIALN